MTNIFGAGSEYVTGADEADDYSDDAPVEGGGEVSGGGVLGVSTGLVLALLLLVLAAMYFVWRGTRAGALARDRARAAAAAAEKGMTGRQTRQLLEKADQICPPNSASCRTAMLACAPLAMRKGVSSADELAGCIDAITSVPPAEAAAIAGSMGASCSPLGRAAPPLLNSRRLQQAAGRLPAWAMQVGSQLPTCGNDKQREMGMLFSQKWAGAHRQPQDNFGPQIGGSKYAMQGEMEMLYNQKWPPPPSQPQDNFTPQIGGSKLTMARLQTQAEALSLNAANEAKVLAGDESDPPSWAPPHESDATA